MKENEIIWFKDIEKIDTNRLGNKATNLGLLYNQFNVPNGFCISFELYNQFIEKTGIKQKIDNLIKNIKKADYLKLEFISKNIKKIIINQKIPDSIKNEILINFKKLKGNVAVRSSASSEDLVNASFAGQHDSFLNIGESKLLISIKKCWASIYNTRAIQYRNKKKISHDVSIAVVIQNMINSDYSGVIFTKDPIHKKDILIEIVKGLGESLVSGKITPNHYFIRRANFTIKEINETFTINSNLLSQIVITGLKIEDKFKTPQDIEFTIKGNKVFVLQSRDITV